MNMENERLKIKAVAQGRPEDWTTWEGVIVNTISVADLEAQLSGKLTTLSPAFAI